MGQADPFLYPPVQPLLRPVMPNSQAGAALYRFPLGDSSRSTSRIVTAPFRRLDGTHIIGAGNPTWKTHHHGLTSTTALSNCFRTEKALQLFGVTRLRAHALHS